jgi:hypothetical protein
MMQTNKPFKAEDIKAIASIPMNFVLGKERSGTTLLQLMLNAHENIIAPPESRFIILLYFRYGKTKQWTEKIISHLCEDLFQEGLFRDFWGIDNKELLSTLLSVKELLNFPLVCKVIFRLSSPNKNEVHIFIDKNPLYYYFLPELNKLFPDAKYIHIVRDYRANLVSHRRVFTVKKGIDIAYRWMKVNMLVEEAKSRTPQNFFTLTYENLVSNPLQNMESVCKFLHLPFDQNMAQNHQSGMFSGFNRNTEERFRKVHQNVFNPIDPALINAWKEKIPPEELMNVEAVAGKYGETMYGYKRTSSRKTASKYTLGYLIMSLKYRVIKTLYRKALANFWLYRSIKKYLWPDF